MAKDDEEFVEEGQGGKDPEQEEDIADPEEREQMEEDAEISSREGAFVEGYEEDEEKSMEKKRKGKK